MDSLLITEAAWTSSAADPAYSGPNYSLIVLAAMIATFVALTATYMLDRVRTSRTAWQKSAWLLGAAVALGCGFWTVHVLAMLGVSDVTVAHSTPDALMASLAVSVAVGALVCGFVGSEKRNPWQLPAAGVALASGLTVMHVATLSMAGPMFTTAYAPGSAVAVLVAALAIGPLLVGSLDLTVASDESPQPARRVLCAAAAGLMLAALSFLTWFSALLMPIPYVHTGDLHISTEQAAPIAAIAVVLINGIALVAAMMERRVRTTSDNAAQRLRLILDSLPVGVAYMDVELCFHFVNLAFNRIYLPDGQDMTGRNLLDMASKEALDEVLPYYRRALAGEPSDFMATTDIGDDLASHRHIFLVPELAPNGTVRGIFIVVNDISEQIRSGDKLRQSQQRLDALLQHVPAAVFMKDRQARYQLVNRQYVEWYGVGNDQVIGRTVHEIFPPERAERYWKSDQEILSSGDVVSDELQIPITNGDWRTFSMTKFPLVDNGETIGYGGIIVDVNERAEAEKALKTSERRAELANRAKSEFLANMSHELRTPLNAILGFTEILREQMLGPMGNDKYVEYATDIHESADHLLGLINDILDLSKIESGADDLLEEDIAVGELMRSVVTLVKGRAMNGQVELIEDIEPDLPPLCGDKRKLKQVIVNLMTNAVKFTPAGGTVTLGAYWESDGSLVLQVSDTGIGMAPEDIPLAMTPFGQIDSAFSRRFEGTGLGLPLASQLMTMHGGSLEIHSRQDEGTTVTARLPASRVVAELRERKARAS